eukprot:12421830-Karenia_brevis.AAC.1
MSPKLPNRMRNRIPPHSLDRNVLHLILKRKIWWLSKTDGARATWTTWFWRIKASYTAAVLMGNSLE